MSRATALMLLTVLGTTILLLGALLVQHFRHGWPFSLHHGIAVQSAASTMPAAASQPTRTAIEVEEDKAAAIGLKTAHAMREVIAFPVRAVATVVPDETRVSHIHTRVSGWVERLFINTTGERVKAGQPLAAIFSQELMASQSEYLAAKKAAASGPPSAVAESARERLKVLGMTDAELEAIEKSGTPRRLVTLTAPRSGIVLRRAIAVGTAVDPSTELMTIADLSRVWVIAEVPEAEIPNVATGTMAALDLPASGQSNLRAPVDFVYPTLSERTRTLRVRFTLPNANGSLRPGIYGSAIFETKPRDALVVPRDAVVDTGETQHVFVAEHPGHYVPRRVRLGIRLEDRVEIREGLNEHEQVVVSGVFLLDSESRLRASGGRGTGHSHGEHGASTAAPASAPSGQNQHQGH
jgi:membrane fusion protein, copper/silver efflux system